MAGYPVGFRHSGDPAEQMQAAIQSGRDPGRRDEPPPKRRALESSDYVAG
jgi:hypothetical protein